MDDQLLLTTIFEGTDKLNMCMFLQFQCHRSGKLGDQYNGGPRASNVGGTGPSWSNGSCSYECIAEVLPWNRL